MIVLWYIALAVMLFFGVKICKLKEWNDENMSFNRTKCFLGFCAVVIVFHHISQATCASWLNPRYVRHGLDIFLTAGYPMVAMFFFCSGYGLYKSARSKENFFRRYIPVRIIPILIPTLITLGVYIFFRYLREIPFNIDSPFAVNGHETWHPYIWYVPCIIYLYIIFYIGFGFSKKDWVGITVVAFGTVGYITFCVIFGYGAWWYNTPHMFLMGILVAKYEKKFFESCKKLYILRLLITILLCVVFHYMGDKGGWEYLKHFHHPYVAKYALICDVINVLSQVIYTFAFVSLYYLLSMKIKLGNKLLGFLGKFTLELYLIHGIFIHMFGYYMIREGKKPIYYIENVPLFVLVVLGLSIPISYGMSLIDKRIGQALRRG
ncbi:MAG: acyltransferase family protein [Eubacterium sp.]|nr:acyltransferase family protein [Eubacterium sp.]